jgi:hypothetical protein
MVKQLQAVNSLGVDIMGSYVDGGVVRRCGLKIAMSCGLPQSGTERSQISVIAKVLRPGSDLRRW